MSIVFAQRAFGQSRHAERPVESLTTLHGRRQHGRVVQAEQVTDFVCESRFEIVRAGRAVSGKLQLSAILGPRLWVDADVGFGDAACFGIKKDARASGRGFRVKRFVFRSGGDGQQTDSVASLGGTDGGHGRPRDDKVDV